MKPASLYPKRTRKEKIKTFLGFYNSFIVAGLIAALLILILFNVGTNTAGYETQILRSAIL